MPELSYRIFSVELVDMGRLSHEFEELAAEAVRSRGGYLIGFFEHEDACMASSQISEFCDGCQRCMAGAPVMSAGEIDPNLTGSGLFVVALLDEVAEDCPIMNDVKMLGGCVGVNR